MISRTSSRHEYITADSALLHSDDCIVKAEKNCRASCVSHCFALIFRAIALLFSSKSFYHNYFNLPSCIAAVVKSPAAKRSCQKNYDETF